MTWRCSLTSSIRPSALIFVGFHNIFLFWLQALLWEGQGYLWEKMPQNVKKSSIWFPFLAQGIEWRCFEVGEFFQGLLPVPCFLWKMPFEIPIFCLNKLINSCQDWELFVQELWNGLKLCSQTSTVFQKNAIKMKMLFSIQLNDLGFWCIQNWCTQILNFLMHQIQNVCVHLGPRSKKFLSEIDLVLISVWQFKLDELEIACLKDQLDYPWIGFSLPVEKWLQVGLN